MSNDIKNAAEIQKNIDNIEKINKTLIKDLTNMKRSLNECNRQLKLLKRENEHLIHSVNDIKRHLNKKT